MLRICLTNQQSPRIQVESCFPELLETINNTSLKKHQQASQEFQADAVRLHTEALRANPAVGGYGFCQLFDSNAIEVDGIVDFWRNKRKKSFQVMQEMNKPLVLILRCSPMNARSGQDMRSCQ